MLYRKSFSVAAVCVCLVFPSIWSCSDENSDSIEQDTTEPTVTLTGVSDNATISGTVVIKVEAEDENGIEKIELSLDGVVVGTTSSINSLVFELNTLDMADSEHTVKAIVTDQSGNPKTEEVKFSVLNALISMDVPSTPFEGTGARRFIFLSDEAGKTIAVQEYKPGDAVRLKAPSFTGKKFFLTEVRIANDNRANMRTFSNVSRCNWTVNPLLYPAAIPYLGLARLKAFNGIPGFDYWIYSNWAATPTRGSADPNELHYADLYIHKEPSLIYVVRYMRDEFQYKWPTHYGLYPPVSIGENNPIDLSHANIELTEVVQDISAYGEISGNVSIVGLARAGHFDERFPVGDGRINESEKTLTYQYPGTAFPEYMSFSELYSGGKTFLNTTRGLPDVKPLDCTIEIESFNSTITGIITGDDVDVVIFSLSGDYEKGYEWQLFGESGIQNVVIPEIPQIVSAALGTTRIPDRGRVSAIDYDDFTEYEEVRDYIISAPEGPSGIGGGSKDGKAWKSVQMELKRP
jgi:hypothetical protein